MPTNKGLSLTPSNSPLHAGDWIHSPSNTCTLTMMSSGDLVASPPGTWHSNTNNQVVTNGYVRMLLSGDLVVYDASNNPFAHSNTSLPGLVLTIDDSGNVHLGFPGQSPRYTNFLMPRFSPAAAVMSDHAIAVVDSVHALVVHALQQSFSRLRLVGPDGSSLDVTKDPVAMPSRNQNGDPKYADPHAPVA
jgi:hypothetical protein